MTGSGGSVSLRAYVPAPARVRLTLVELLAIIGSMARRRVTLSDQVRAAVDASGLSRYRICMETDISQAAMSRFMSGQGGLSMKALDRLADFLNLNITTGKRRRAKGR